jgi:hypothetical protein
MKGRENLVERRRERARVGVMAQLEDITYRTLCKYDEVPVTHDSHNRPFVVDKGAA